MMRAATGNDDSGEGGGKLTAPRETKRARAATAMAIATRVADNEEGVGDGSKNDGNGDKGGGRAMATRALVVATMWAMTTATRVVDDK